ncbi:hypothetical protein ACUOFC_55520, partial [Escherichia sp. TWPC-MK]
VARDELTAEKAAQLVSIEWQELPVITTPEAALAEDAAPIYHKPSKEAAYFAEFQAMKMETPKVENYKETLFALLQQPTIASKEWVYDQYDYQVRTS